MTKPIRCWLASIPRKLTDFLMPPRCLCHTIVAQNGWLCPACWKQLDFIQYCCHRCGAPMPYIEPTPQDTSAQTLCLRCHDNRNTLRGRSAVMYNDFAKHLLMQFKYGDQCRLAFVMTQFMMKQHEIFKDIDAMVAVPLHFWRLLGRRYNQSALLARQISAITHIPVLCKALIKKRYQPSQGQFSYEERHANVHDTFIVTRSVTNKRILLVDDVIASGATLNECARVLCQAGAREVRFVTFARVC